MTTGGDILLKERKVGNRPAKPRRKLHPLVRAVKITALTFLSLVCIYIVFTYSNIPFLRNLRHMAIETSLSTMRHQWVAHLIFPEDVVNDVMKSVYLAREGQIGITSSWDDLMKTVKKEYDTQRQAFFHTFRELDEISFQRYLIEHPATLRSGWENIYINEAGLDDKGTTITTTNGDQVLAIDAKNKVLLIRITGPAYRGVLAIAKDPSRLSIRTAENIGYSGQLVGEIATANNGILALNASGFLDVDTEGNVGQGNGGIIGGLARCNGVTYGDSFGIGHKRIELRSDDRMYIVDSLAPIHADCTDAAEFSPALIVDGQVLVDENTGWNAVNPRSCIGQNDQGDIMMLAIEGRQLSSLGIGVAGCARIMAQYDCMQAINLDGGTSSILWFDGECVTSCSNSDYPEGRPLPNAFIYTYADE